MDKFPVITCSPNFNFGDEPSKGSVLVGSTASGYPVLNKLFTFTPRIFTLEYRSVPDADKLTMMTFYETHKDIPFYWLNEQDDSTYEVCFLSEPACRVDEQKDLWRISLELIQTSP